MLPVGDDGGRLLRWRPTAIASLTFFWLLILVFAAQLLLTPGGAFIPTGLAFVPGTLFGGAEQAAEGLVIPPPATLVSYQFLQAGGLHLLVNLLFLWAFGPVVEQTLGPGRWTVLLLACGAAAALAQAWPDPSSHVPMIGSGGGISGILGAHLSLQPRAEFRPRIPLADPGVLRLPAWVVLFAWFLMQLLYSTWTGTGTGGVVFRAHLGGFVCGLLLAPMLHSMTLLSADARAVARTLRSRDSSH